MVADKVEKKPYFLTFQMSKKEFNIDRKYGKFNHRTKSRGHGLQQLRHEYYKVFATQGFGRGIC